MDDYWYRIGASIQPAKNWFPENVSDDLFVLFIYELGVSVKRILVIFSFPPTTLGRRRPLAGFGDYLKEPKVWVSC